MPDQPLTIYEAVPPATAETTIMDVLLGAASVVGGLALGAVLLGLVCAGVLIRLRRARNARLDDMTEMTRLRIDASSRRAIR